MTRRDRQKQKDKIKDGIGIWKVARLSDERIWIGNAVLRLMLVHKLLVNAT